LNDAWADLRHAYALPLWPAYSMMMSAVMVAAIAGEARGRPAAWNKLVRTGVRSPRPVGAEP
ncbi:MAG TPA: glucosaminyltransferase, partial [Microbacterium sp.]|nr:glucosaminyltransferase [Microbacterium sp.]